jgi:biopolymer transport protein ExbB
MILAAGWPIWPLIASSVLALAIVIERYLSLTDAKIAPAGLTRAVIDNLSEGLPPPDSIAQLERNSLLGKVLASALWARSQDAMASDADIRAAAYQAGRVAAQTLELRLTALATIASAAPLMGLLGTVVGLIEIFGAQSPGSVGGNPAQLAQGISIALYNTAFGLIVAIPALVFWRYFRALADAYLLQLESGADQLMRRLRAMDAS